MLLSVMIIAYQNIRKLSPVDKSAIPAISRTRVEQAPSIGEGRDEGADKAFAPAEHRIHGYPFALTKHGTQALSETQVEFSDGLLSVDVHSRSVRWLMAQISSQTGVAILASDSLVDSKLSRSFRDLPLEEGIRTALGDYDLFTFYGSDDGMQGPGRLEAVWVYPRGEGRMVMPTPPDTWASTGDLEQNLNSSEPELRAIAAETLLERQGELAAGKVMPALKDRDEAVRLRTLIALQDAAVALTPELLADMVQQDPSPALRATALIGLAGHTEANRELVQAAAESALSDVDASVVQNARGILEQLTMTTAGEAVAEKSAQQ